MKRTDFAGYFVWRLCRTFKDNDKGICMYCGYHAMDHITEQA